MENQWLVQNNRRVQLLKKELLKYSYQSSQELPATTILAVLESAIIEIVRVQKDLDEANKEIKTLREPKKVEAKDGE